MKFKMRVLHHSVKGNAEAIADAIGRAQACNVDKIPPAYPIENEKLSFIGMEIKGASPAAPVLALVKDLSPARTKNVAIFGVGKESEAVDALKKAIEERGITVVSTHLCNPSGGGLFSKKISDSDIKACVDWANKLVESL